MSQEIDVWRISETAHYIESHGYRVVTTQFPDDLLADAISVTTRLCDACSQIGHVIDVRSKPFFWPNDTRTATFCTVSFYIAIFAIDVQ
jgi:diphthamide synthase subunit DPH2